MKRVTMAIGGICMVLIFAFYLQHSGASLSERTEAVAGLGQVAWDVKQAKVNKNTNISFSMENEKGEELRSLGDAAQRAIRAVVVPSTLSSYDEVQPSFLGAGAFSFPYTFKKAGEYVIFTYVKDDAGQAFASKRVTVGEKKPAKTSLAPDALMSTTIGPYDVSLIFPALRPDRPSELVFQFAPKDRKTLSFRSAGGAASSILLVDEKQEHLLYAEPVRDEKGKELAFSLTFPKEGLYKMWASLYIDGKMYKKSFVLHVAKTK